MIDATRDIIEQIATAIDRVRAKSHTKLIALDGRGGSGKSTLAQLLIQLRPEYTIVHLDDFPCRADEHPFHPLGTQTAISTARVLEDVIHPLQEGRRAYFAPTPWWITQSNQPQKFKEVRPGGAVIIEGCYALRSELRSHYDLTICVTCELNEALANALSRDGGERDRIFWEQVYIPNEGRYIESERPMECADIVVVNKARTFSIERIDNTRVT